MGSGPVFCCFLVFAVCFVFPLAKRKSGWGICGSSCWLVFVVVCCFNRFACPIGHDMSLYKYLFCLCSCKDRAFSATSATLEGKSPCCACMSLSRSPFGRLAFLSFFLGGRERYRDNATSEELRLLTYRDHQSWVSHVGSSGNVACSLLLVPGPNPLEERAVKSAIGMSSLTSGFAIWLSDGCACHWL